MRFCLRKWLNSSWIIILPLLIGCGFELCLQKGYKKRKNYFRRLHAFDRYMKKWTWQEQHWNAHELLQPIFLSEYEICCQVITLIARQQYKNAYHRKLFIGIINSFNELPVCLRRCCYRERTRTQPSSNNSPYNLCLTTDVWVRYEL